MTGDDHSAPDVDAVRAILREEQSRAAGSAMPADTGPGVTEAALEFYGRITKTIAGGDDGVRRGAFRYHADREAARIARGEAFIRRVQPGPLEDPNYFAMLAYQAASIELTYAELAHTFHGMQSGTIEWRTDAPPTEDYESFSKFLLGTVHAADVNAFSWCRGAGDYTVVLLNSGLVDFAYQAAKVVIEATRPRRTTEQEPGLVKTSMGPEAVRRNLAADPAPVDRLYRTLEAYYFHGYPRATAFEVPPDEYGPPLVLLTDLAERFIIAHEYGHGIGTALAGVPDGVLKPGEYFADTNAMIITVASAARFDGVPPEFPLGGGVFTLACLDVLRRALSLLSTGEEHTVAAETRTHPAPRARADGLITGFRRFFDIAYHPDHSFDLWFSPMSKDDVSPDHGFTEDHSDYAYRYANVLQTVWRPVKDRLLVDRQLGRPLHPMWRRGGE